MAAVGWLRQSPSLTDMTALLGVSSSIVRGLIQATTARTWARQPRLIEPEMVSADTLLWSHGWGLTFADQQLPSGPPRAPAPEARSGGLSRALQGILPCTPRLALPRQQEPRRWAAFHPPGLQPGRSSQKLVRCSLHTYQTMLCTDKTSREAPCCPT